MHYIYWIHAPHHTNPKTEGYIGISNNPKNRLTYHRNTKDNPILKNAFIKYDVVQTILHENIDRDIILEYEKHYRPTDHIGWNIIPGGSMPPSRKGKPSPHLSKMNTTNPPASKKIRYQNKEYPSCISLRRELRRSQKWVHKRVLSGEIVFIPSS